MSDCQARRADGSPCGAPAQTGRAYCYQHDPEPWRRGAGGATIGRGCADPHNGGGRAGLSGKSGAGHGGAIDPAKNRNGPCFPCPCSTGSDNKGKPRGGGQGGRGTLAGVAMTPPPGKVLPEQARRAPYLAISWKYTLRLFININPERIPHALH